MLGIGEQCLDVAIGAHVRDHSESGIQPYQASSRCDQKSAVEGGCEQWLNLE